MSQVFFMSQVRSHQSSLCDFFLLLGVWYPKDSLLGAPWNWHEGMGERGQRGAWGPEPKGWYAPTLCFQREWASIHGAMP